MAHLRPQDIVVLLKLAALRPESFVSYPRLAEGTGLSTGEVHKSLARSETAGLYNASRRSPVYGRLAEFVVHGVPHAYPAIRAGLGRGVPTSIAAPPLDRLFMGAGTSPERTPVWLSPHGTKLGYGISPLYSSVPRVAVEDPAFYELLALVDALREGRARERALAADDLRRRLSP
jgi:hypothetical protein